MQELKSNIAFIYTLSDPFTREIRYVGKTTKKLKYRVYEHLIRFYSRI